MQTIAEQRALLTAEDTKNKLQFAGDNASYPFWLLGENKTASIRLLPDGNPENPFNWVERQNIKLKFEGNVTITVPCAHMFGQQDQIIDYIKPWWADPAKADVARQYYKKRSYIFQGFVVASDLVEQNVPENPIRRFVMNKGVYEIIKSGLMNPDLEDHPADFDLGRDFRLIKTKRGEYADYSTSCFAFKVRPLSKTEREAIDKYGLTDLSTALGRKPDRTEWDAIFQMFKDSLDGKPYDVESYGAYFKPYTPKDASGAGGGGAPMARANVGSHAAEMLATIKQGNRSTAPKEAVAAAE